MNRFSEADPLYRRALAIDEHLYDADHPNIAGNLNNLAGLLYRANQLSEAEELMRPVTQIYWRFTRDTGHEHVHLRQAMINFANLLERMGYRHDQVRTKLNEIANKYGFSFST